MDIAEKLDGIKNWQVVIILVFIGLSVFSTGLSNPFWGDDYRQIVNNVPVHSLSNIGVLFSGSTFYDGQDLAPLSGTWYRPLMMVTFSFLYSLFGPNPVYFHLMQLVLHISAGFLLYLFLKYSFRPILALAASLLFLVHPINSQAVMSIPSMQETLVMFFGLLSLWMLLRFKSVKSLFFVALVTFFGMLSKESSIVFIALALLYLLWWDRCRLFWYIGITSVPTILYLVLRVNAVGFVNSGHAAPITDLNLLERIFTMASIPVFYLFKFIFPWQLGTAYYWTFSDFSIRNFLLPVLIIISILMAAIMGALLVRRRLSSAQYYTYLFFSLWLLFGLLPYLQIIPLDMTASETWFYISMPGLLGMLGVLFRALRLRISPATFSFVTAVILVALGLRTSIRSFDYRDTTRLAYADIAASKENHVAYDTIAASLTDSGRHNEALDYSYKSIAIWPNASNYYNLGIIYLRLGDYSKASEAFRNAIKYPGGDSDGVRMNISTLALFKDNYSEDIKFISESIGRDPDNSELWRNLAILYAKSGDWKNAGIAIETAATHGEINKILYNKILNGEPFKIYLENFGEVLIQ